MFRERERERERERGEGERKKERERERERETKQTKARCSCQSHVALPVFLSPVDEQESTLTNENKTQTTLPPFRFDQPRQAIIPCELTRHDHCVHDCLPRRERQLVNSISNVETWNPTFPQRVDNRLASNRKDQVIECLLEQLLLRFKRKVGCDDMVRQKSSKLKNHNEKSRNLLDDSCRKLAECGLTGNACTCRDRRYGTPW